MADHSSYFVKEEISDDFEVLEAEDDDSIDWTETFSAPEIDWRPSESNADGNIPSNVGDFNKSHNHFGQNQMVVDKDEKKNTDSAQSLKRMELNDHKAGMVGLDKEKINQIIFEASKGSRFYENEMKKEKQVAERIRKQSACLQKINEEQRHEALQTTDLIVRELEKARDLRRTFVHIDMDAFYAAVEILDNPLLRDKPMAVGGNAMLSTSNYPARRYGVRAAMPGFIAKKLCPDLVIVPPHFEKYKEYSRQVQEVLVEYDRNFVMASLDEAYLDLTEVLKERQKKAEKRTFRKEQRDAVEQGTCEMSADAIVEFGNDAEEVVKELRFRIEQKTRLTASAGIAPNVLLAKVCSDRNKPNGQFLLKPDRQVILDFVHALPIRKVSGIGRVSEQMLKALGIETCGDLFAKRDLLYLLHSPVSFKFLIRVSLGLGNTSIATDSKRKSIGTEITFPEMSKPEELLDMCDKLCQSLAEDMKKEKLKGKTVTIKLKTVNFEVKSRSLSPLNPVSTYGEIALAAKELLKHEINVCSPDPLKLRLMGVRLSNFQDSISDSSKEGRQNTIKGFLRPQESVATKETPYCAAQTKKLNLEELSTVKIPVNETFTEVGTSVVASLTSPSTHENDSYEFESSSSSAIGVNLSGLPSSALALNCPVCGQKQLTKPGEDAMIELNKHIDLCLNKSTIREIVSENNKSQSSEAIVNIACSSDQLKVAETRNNGGKRKRQQSGAAMSKKATLYSFWSQ
ncbi:DNA polymerase kappa-like [Montipora capricornis]|uniref:DNA polymerase kappa-like n=1 Tax=Montipora capricornis TaxID=246305 RepID=UPI0035F10B14